VLKRLTDLAVGAVKKSWGRWGFGGSVQSGRSLGACSRRAVAPATCDPCGSVRARRALCLAAKLGGTAAERRPLGGMSESLCRCALPSLRRPLPISPFAAYQNLGTATCGETSRGDNTHQSPIGRLICCGSTSERYDQWARHPCCFVGSHLWECVM
jgi:hypothetical protein